MLNTKLFDHTILKADATEAQVAKICDEALAHDFASVCVNQYYTKFVAEKLKGSDVKVCTVVGFPLGMSDTRVKAFETRTAIEDGAQEVDMVINVGALKDGKYDFVRSDIQTLKFEKPAWLPLYLWYASGILFFGGQRFEVRACTRTCGTLP